MLLPFYHRIPAMKHLVHIGDFDVPPDTLIWRMPVVDRTVHYFEGPHFVPPRVTGEVIEYKRQRGEVFDCMVADIPLKVADSPKDETQL